MAIGLPSSTVATLDGSATGEWRRGGDSHGGTTAARRRELGRGLRPSPSGVHRRPAHDLEGPARVMARVRGGTLLIDEIADIEDELQARIVRMMDTPGDHVPRFMATSQSDLTEAMESGRVRQDLYYRLSVFVITSPPLRSRKNDIPDLILFFLDKYNKQYCRHISPPNHSIMSRLKAYDWPGNVRELKHAIERAVVLSSENELDLREVIGTRQQSSTHPADTATAYSEAKELFEKNYLQRILNLAGGNVSEAARISGRFRSDIYRMMKRYNIKSPS